MQDADLCKFSDSQAEGPFSTAASRCTADAYIQGQIRGYERIIRYYNRCSNALTITCRIPPGILSAIFSEVAQCAWSQSTYYNYTLKNQHLDWIQSVSHVCSYWRKVALNVPKLWSNITLNNPPWAEEMVRRSNLVPLTISYQGPMNVTKNERAHSSLKTLTEILRFHLPRIKSLTLYSRQIGGRSFRYDWTSSEPISILPLLNQPAPMMESLHVMLLGTSENKKLPYELFTTPSRLRHLTLEYCGMVWDHGLIEFGNLRSLELSYIPQQINPSLNQLLTMLRQMSHLESLKLYNRDQATNLGDSCMLHGIDPVILRHLDQIRLTGGLSYCELFNHLVFSQNACSIKLDIQDLPEISSPLAHSLAEKFDNGIEGSTVSLSLNHVSIICWKSKDTAHIPSFRDPPTIDISCYKTMFLGAGFFWRHLRLNQLIALEIYIPLEQDAWTFFANLPQLRDVRIRSFPNKFLSALHHGLVGISDSTADVQPVNVTFPALRNLTMVQCSLDSAANVKRDAFSPSVSVVQSMLSGFEIRKNAGLPLECLRLEACTGFDYLQLKPLEVVIKRVMDYYSNDDDGFEYSDLDGPGYEPEEADEHLQEDYDYDDYEEDYDHDDHDIFDNYEDQI